MLKSLIHTLLTTKAMLPAAGVWLAFFSVSPGGVTQSESSIDASISATNYSGSDIGERVDGAEAACIAHGRPICGIVVPPNPKDHGIWTYATTMAFSIPTTLRCTPGTVLNFTGTGNAVTLGPYGLTPTVFHTYPYTVEGCTFTGGTSMAEGLFFNSYVTQANVLDTHFHNFGRAGAWNIWLQGQNWDVRIDRVQMWDDVEHTGGTFNGIYTNSDGDYGQSQLHVTNTLIQNIAAGAGEGTGIFLNAYISVVDTVTISNMVPNIRIGGQAAGSHLSKVYMETAIGGPACITYGDAPGDNGGTMVGAYVVGVTLKDIYCNVHNTDFGTKTYFMAPTTSLAGIQNSVFEDVLVSNSAPGHEAIRENNRFSQSGNVMNRYTGTTKLHTSGSHIAPWNGSSLVVVN